MLLFYPAADPTASGPGPPPPLHLAALADARVRCRKVRRAANVASLSGWTMAVFAFITLAGSIFGDMVALVLGVALGLLAFNELRGSAMLRNLQPSGARRLGYNQLALGLLLVGYAAYSLASAMFHPLLASSVAATGDAELDAMLARISATAAYALYGGLALAGIVAPGLTAWYYFSRERHVRQALLQTPEWAVQALRAAG
ncbi:MAG TPA: hypothetical protein PKE29_17705 [Phycisphaerales bacterium]|nr:hypothetical protein [Phycisphaerales bacterium]